MNDITLKEVIFTWEGIIKAWQLEVNKVADDTHDPRFGIRVRMLDRITIAESMLADLRKIKQ